MFGLGKKKAGGDSKPVTTAAASQSKSAPSPSSASESKAAALPPAPVEEIAPPSGWSPPELAPGGEFVPGLMQDRPFNLASILEFAARHHRDQEIVSALIEGGRHRQTFAQTLARTKRCANALRRLGVRPGDRVATLAWNTHRHVEAWYAISGQGAICHTVNPRLFPEQVVYIINHAGNRFLLTDLSFVPLVEKIRDQLTSVEQVVVLAGREHMPKGDGWLCYEDLLAGEAPEFDWPEFPGETASSLCYTSGTTGDPKGVLYSHDSNRLLAYALSTAAVMPLGTDDSNLMIVPMFHANAWALVYACPLAGAKMVLPGMALDGASVHSLIKDERVTSAAAVPTVWNMLLEHLDKTGGDLAPMREVIMGGSAVPRSMFDTFKTRYGIDVIQGWGMTEMSPTGTVSRLLPKHEGLSWDDKLDILVKAGRPIFGVEMKIVDDHGHDLPQDGEASGRLLVRGPWIAKAYVGRDEAILDDDGWFDTGDMGSIDPDGYLAITDRAKDVIKSGGEWISSVDLENAAVAHADVSLACAIGVPHPKWQERPLMLVVPREGAQPDTASIKALLADEFADWQLPDDIVLVDELPMTATGKYDKKVLREEYADHLMAKAAE